MTYSEYWSVTDREQAKLLKFIIKRFNVFNDSIDDINNIYNADGKLSERMLGRFHRDIDKIDIKKYNDRNFELSARDLQSRSRIDSVDAFYFLIWWAAMDAYFNIRNESIIRNQIVATDKFQDIGDISKLYNQEMPSGLTPDETINREATFRTTQIFRALRSGKIFPETLKRNLKLELDRSINSLLKPSETHGFHGIMDVLTTTILGYTMIERAKETGAETYDYHAVIDNRTTDICKYLDGKTFKVSEMRLGWNVPPISMDMRTNTNIPHPCRSWITLVYNK